MNVDHYAGLPIDILDGDIVPVEDISEPRDPDAAPGTLLPKELHDRVALLVIHDGSVIPSSALGTGKSRIPLSSFAEDYVRERDWGASEVARRTAASLGIGSCSHVRIARVLMDFGRFPGETPEGADHLRRFALNYPFSNLLGFDKKRQVLERWYDGCSDVLEPVVRGRSVMLGIHTYDPLNESGTGRPDVSIITRPIGYQIDSRMPVGVFDPLFPDVLAEYTADRVLRDRLSITLEKAHLRVAHNYPYCFPEGSVEVRSQVWFFFDWLRREFEAAHVEVVGDPAFGLVWDMLLNTNLRSAESDALRSHVHFFRRAPRGRAPIFRRALEAYHRVAGFVNRDERAMIERYRCSLDRPSSMAVEVRKDLVYRFDDRGMPIGPRTAAIKRIGDLIARALVVYFTEDKPAMREAPTIQLDVVQDHLDG
jgi:hypothetical protein